jgi:hypothetical protein
MRYSGVVHLRGGAVFTVDIDDEGDAELVLVNYRTAKANPSRSEIEDMIAMLQEAHKATTPGDWNPNAV